MAQRVIIIGYKFKDEGRDITDWEAIGKKGHLKKVEINDKYCIYLLDYPKREFENEDENKMNKKIEEIEDEDRYKKILILLHGEESTKIPWSSKNLPSVNESTTIKLFSGGSGIIYEHFIVNAKNYDYNFVELSKNTDWDEIWEAYYSEALRAKRLFLLSPLHLSLQAFFGISRDENGEFVKVGTRKGENETDKQLKDILQEINKQRGNLKDGNEEISDDYRKLFPNPDAFMLVPEAEWDFYASIFDKVMPECSGNKADGDYNECAGEREDYEGKRIRELLGELAENPDTNSETLNNLKKAFDEGYEKPDGEYKGIKASPKVFVNCLREICAILANTCDDDSKCKKNNIEVDCDDSKKKITATFCYKGKCKEERNKILQKLGKDFKNPHCKLEENGYNILREQIAKWGIEKAKVVIAGIEELAKMVKGEH